MSSSIKVNLEKDSYDIIFDENFVESAMALIAISSKCMFITQEIIYEKLYNFGGLPTRQLSFVWCSSNKI